MQHYLNTLQNEYKYTVINDQLDCVSGVHCFGAMGSAGLDCGDGWALTTPGVGCGSSQGVGNRSVIDLLSFTTRRPVFYRGRLENEVMSGAITGKQYVPNTQMFDQTSTDKNPSRRQIASDKGWSSERQSCFLPEISRGNAQVISHAGYILSTQPIINEFSGDFADIYQFPAGSDAHRAAMTGRERELEKLFDCPRK